MRQLKNTVGLKTFCEISTLTFLPDVENKYTAKHTARLSLKVVYWCQYDRINQWLRNIIFPQHFTCTLKLSFYHSVHWFILYQFTILVRGSLPECWVYTNLKIEHLFIMIWTFKNMHQIRVLLRFCYYFYWTWTFDIVSRAWCPIITLLVNKIISNAI